MMKFEAIQQYILFLVKEIQYILLHYQIQKAKNNQVEAHNSDLLDSTKHKTPSSTTAILTIITAQHPSKIS